MKPRRALYILAAWLLMSSVEHDADSAPQPRSLEDVSLSIEAFGAIANMGKDNTDAIRNAIASAALHGQKVYVPAGTFDHRAFELNGVKMFGAGPSRSILQASDPGDATIILSGDDASLSDLSVRVENARRRNGTHDAVKIEEAGNFEVNKVTIQGPEGTCIFTTRSHDGKITNNTCRNSLSDGIHNTGASYNLIIANNFVSNAGDDSIAVVSYAGRMAGQQVDKGPVHNVLIQGNNTGRQNWGRCYSVVGGNDITIQDNIGSYDSQSPGISVAQEDSSDWVTFGSNNIKIIGNFIYNINDPDYGAAIVFSAASDLITNLLFESNSVIRALGDGVRIEVNGPKAAVRNISFINNNFSMIGSAAPINVWSKPALNIYCWGSTIDGRSSNDESCTGKDDFVVTGSSLSYP